MQLRSSGRDPAGAGNFQAAQAGKLSVPDNGNMQHIVVQDAAWQGLLKCMSPVLLQCNVSGGDTICHRPGLSVEVSPAAGS